MKWKIQILATVCLLSINMAFSQCSWKIDLNNEIDKSETFTRFISENDNRILAYKLLYLEEKALATNLDELSLVSNNLDEIQRAGGYKKWKLANSGGSKLIDLEIINELKDLGIKFTEADLKFLAKDYDKKILFLEKGNSNAGFMHLIERHWNPKELMKYFDTQEELVEKLFTAIKNDKYLTKQVVMKNGREALEYTYKLLVKGKEKIFKLGVGSNGFIVTFYPI